MLDLHTPEMTQRFAEATIYAKFAVISIRPIEAGQTIDTVLSDGRLETSNTSKEDNYLATNPGGEQYIISGQDLADRYTALGGGRYQAKGMVRAFLNPTGADISVLAPWGELQHGGSDAMLAVVCDPTSPDEIGSNRYIIGGQQFTDTYAPLTEIN